MAVLNAAFKFLLSIALVFLVIALLPAFLITDDISLFETLFDMLFRE